MRLQWEQWGKDLEKHRLPLSGVLDLTLGVLNGVSVRGSSQERGDKT